MDVPIIALKVNIAFSAMLLVYWLVMRRNSWFMARRFWLLGAAAISVILPFIPTPVPSDAALSFTLPLAEVRSMDGSGGSRSTGFILPVYLIISLLLIIRLLVRIHLARSTGKEDVEGAYSFFGKVHLPELAPAEDLHAMRIHEELHVRQWHSADVVLFELLCALWWINPAWWLARKELRLVHEHLADAEAAMANTDYDRLLLASACGTSPSALFNRFHSSDLKTRIIMLNNTINDRRSNSMHCGSFQHCSWQQPWSPGRPHHCRSGHRQAL